MGTPEIAPASDYDLVFNSDVFQGNESPKTDDLDEDVVMKKTVKFSDENYMNIKDSPPASQEEIKRNSQVIESNVLPSTPVPSKKSKTTEDNCVSSPPLEVSHELVYGSNKSVDESNNAIDCGSKSVDTTEGSQKVWVNNIASGEVVEINLDKFKQGKKYEINDQKNKWNLAPPEVDATVLNQIDFEKYVPLELMKKLEGKTKLTEEDKEVSKRVSTLVDRWKKLIFLKAEAALVGLDKSLKSALNNSNPQILKCCELLTEVLDMDIQPLMLKKQPHVVNTIRKLKRYAGPQDQSGYNDQEKKDIKSGVKLITEKSGACYDKFSNLFPGFRASAGDKHFHDFFLKQVEEFKNKTKAWDEDEILSLSEDLLDE